MLKKLFIIFLSVFLPIAALAQGTRVVTGTVSDEKGEPLPGVFVLISGTTTGTTTDLDGHYSISVPAGKTLEFSAIGFIKKTVATGNQTVISVSLEEDMLLLDEVVVVGYGTQRKVDLTGAVDQVGSDVFISRPNSNVTQMLEGAIPNLNISLADGKPIRTADFNIRGTTSIGQGGSALILIDGVEGDPAYLNPDDIASVSVLKDAASAAIYGSRAPYGVVLITTKNPSKARTSVNYSNNFTISQPVVKPQYVTDGFVWATHYYEGFYNYNETKPTDMNTMMPFTLSWLNEYRYRHDTGNFGTIVSDGSFGVDAGKYVYFNEGTDWFDILYKDHSFAQTHNISISGSNDTFDYYVSGRLYNYYGLYNTTVNTDDGNSQNMRVKVGYKPYTWLRLSNNFEMGHRLYNNPIASNSSTGNIWAEINSDGTPCMPMYNPDGTFTKVGAYTVGGFLYGHSKNVYETDYIRNTIGFTASFFDNSLTVNGDASYKLNDYNGLIRIYPVEFSPAPGVLETKPGQLSSISQDHADTKYLSANLFTEYTQTFGKHYLKALLGYNYEQRTYSRLYTYNTDILSENVENINLSFGTENKKATGSYNKWRSVGVFSRINYSYADRYLLQFNGRFDGSSKFPSNERWAFFPSLSAGWRITEEPWMKGIGKKVLSNAKLRMSWGTLGNSNVDPYYYDETFSFGNSRLLGGAVYRKTSAPDPIPTNLTWERSTTYDAGIDLGFLNDRLQFTGDIYVRKTQDMFTDGPSIQAVYGAESPKGNYAELSTRGFELVLIWKDSFSLAGKPFGYSLKGTLADYVSRIDKFNNDLMIIGGSNTPEYYPGMIIGERWGFTSYGLWQNQEDIDAAEARAREAGQPHYDSLNQMDHNYNLHPGDIKIEDLNGNGYIDRGDQTLGNPGDRSIIANVEPRFLYSFTMSADWNNFYASVFFQGVGKRDYITGGDSGLIWGQYNRGYNQLPKWQLGNYWTEDNPDAWMPRYSSRMSPFYSIQRRANTRYILDASYIRLKNITFGYNLPEKWVKPLRITRASVFFSGENIWDWSPMYKHVWGTVDVLSLGGDPENAASDAGSGASYPILSSYSFGVNLTF